MGGNLSYQYLGFDSTSGNYRYLVKINLFRLCDAGSTLLPVQMNLGVYRDNVGNPNGDKIQVLSTVLPLVIQQGVTPPNGNDSCTFAPNVCVEEGIYQDTISVTPNTTGYYFISDLCCRNNNIFNLDNPGGAAEAYYAKAPAPTLVNSSPTFAVAPVPFICNTDTASVLNQAFDPDGDLLVYNFAVPYNGIADGGTPNPIPPVQYPFPIQTVNYAFGYSLAAPFGALGYAAMNSATGLAQYFSPNQGFYVIAVEIEEYRNGVLIGVSRRDIQIIVIACPSNPAPVLSSTTSQTTFTIQEGDTLCFNTTFNDFNGDSIFVGHTGDIFNNAITNPPATFVDNSGDGTATGQFCWATTCDQGNSVPYQFSVFATDNGCPAKVTNVVYTVNVQNTLPPSQIFGADTLCSLAGQGLTYYVNGLPGYSYVWTIVNGSILGSNTGDSVLVNLNGTGITVLTIAAVSPNGCVSDTISKKIHVTASPNAQAGNDITICSEQNGSIGIAPSPGVSYSWSPATGLSSSTVSNPVVNITNTGSTPVTTTYVLNANLSGCPDTDTVNVTVNPRPAPSAGPDVALCSGDSIGIGTVAVSGNTYSWSPATGLSSTSISNPVVTLTNSTGAPVTVQYIVVTQNSFLCETIDTVNVTVNVVPVAAAGNDVEFCSGSSANIGSASTAGYTYSWNPSSGLSSGSTSNPTVTLTNTSGQNDTLNYIVTTTLGSCPSSDTVQVVVKPNPVSEAGGNQFVCGSGTFQIGTTPTAGYTYSWSPATGLSNSTISDPVLTVNSGSSPDTLIYVVTTTLNGCITTDSVQIITVPQAVAVAGADVSFCSGNTAGIGATSQPDYIYTWFPATGLSSSTIGDPTVTLTNTSGVADTLYYIVTADLFGCIDNDTVQVIVKPNPASVAGSDATLCGGDTLQLGTASTIGYTYSWSPSAGLSSSTISNPVLIVGNTGATTTATYTVTTELNGCVTTDDVTITINPRPIVSVTANALSICNGSSATLTASGANTYGWAVSTSPGTIISTDSVLTVNPTSTTTYILTGTNSFACSDLTTITITVNPLPVIQIASASATLCSGDSLTLTASGGTNYTWSVSGGGTIGTGTSIQVSPLINTTYIVTGTDGNLCSNTDSISITVNPAATLSSISGTLSVCPGITGVQYWVNNPDPNSTYVWTVTNGTIASGQNTDTITVDWSSVSGTGTISVTEATSLGCLSAPVTISVNINTLLTPPAPAGLNILCANEAQGIIYTALNTSGSTYNWFAQGGVIASGNGSSTVTVNWNVAGPQTVLLWYEESSITAVDTCFGTSDTLSVTIQPVPVTGAISGGIDICVSGTGSFTVANTTSSTYNWIVNGGTIVSGNGTNTITANLTGVGTATISVIETNVFGCVGDTVSLPVTVHSLPAANAGDDVSVCIGQSVQLQASGGVSYLWSPAAGLSSDTIFNPIASPAVATNYIVYVVDNFSCANTDTVLVSVNALPVITLTSNSPVCIGNSIQLIASGGNQFQWSPAGSLDNPNIYNPVATPTATTTYTVVVTDQNTCVDSSVVTITVNPLPAITATGSDTICAGTSTTLTASGGVSYSWTPAGSLDNSTSANPVATPDVTTVYTVTGTDANGCSNTAQTTVDINVQPEASFTVEDSLKSLTCNGYSGNLINTSQNALTYEWIFPNGNTSVNENPFVHLNLSGNNLITLIAINNICRDTLKSDFISTAIAQLFSKLPNIITPNGDGFNDCYEFGENINLKYCSEWEIRNRWGEKVFSGAPKKDCWNGNKENTGKPLPAGTYYIIVNVAGQSFNGTITLIR